MLFDTRRGVLTLLLWAVFLSLGPGSLIASSEASPAPGSLSSGAVRVEGSARMAAFEQRVFQSAMEGLSWDANLMISPTSGASDSGEGRRVTLGRASESLGLSEGLRCVPHRALSFHLLVRERSLVRGIEDLRERSVVVIDDSAAVPHLWRLGLGGHLKRTTDVRQAAALLRNGSAEVAVLEELSVSAELSPADLEGLRMLGDPILVTGLSYCLEGGSAAERRELEWRLRSLKHRGEIESMLQETLSHSGSNPFVPSEGAKAGGGPFAWVLAGLFAVLGAVILCIFALRRRSMDRILNLQEQVMEEKVRVAEIRDDAAKKGFVLNQLSAVSLVDQLLESSRSGARALGSGGGRPNPE